MMARKKVEAVQVAAHRSLEKRIKRAGSDESLTALMEKDRHLIEAALASDKRVASLDDRVRRHFRTHVTKLSEVLSICWVNPNMPDEAPVAWLESGAPAERSRTLAYVSTESNP